MTDFAVALAVSADICASLYGESVTITPMARKSGDANARFVPDTGRDPATCVGIWDDNPADLYPHARDYKDASSHKISAGQVTLSIAKTALPYEPQQNDIVTRASNGARMIVSNPADDGISEWVLALSAKAP